MLFTKILLPIDINDPSSWEKTLPACVSMLKRNPEAQLWILSVIPNFGLNMVESYFPSGWMKEISAKTIAELEIIVKKHVPDDIKPSLIVCKGVVYQAIIEHVTNLEIDLIIMSAGRPSNKDYLLGPNAARVVRHAEISVLIQR
jgi:nucleotide-binding universal stress UspA family protein